MSISRRSLLTASAAAAVLPRAGLAQELKPGKPYAATTVRTLKVVPA